MPNHLPIDIDTLNIYQIEKKSKRNHEKSIVNQGPHLVF